ncbi:MAG: hypothetical protein ACREJ5_18840, partial [Geminicoccaceae bacterium]
PPNHPPMVPLGRLGGGAGWCELIEKCASFSNTLVFAAVLQIEEIRRFQPVPPDRVRNAD